VPLLPEEGTYPLPRKPEGGWEDGLHKGEGLRRHVEEVPRSPRSGGHHYLPLPHTHLYILPSLYEYASAVHFNFSAQLTGDPNLGWAFNQDTSEFFQGGVWADALLALPLGILVIAASNYVPTAKTLEYVQFPLYLATLFLAASIFKPIALNILMYHGSDLYGPMLYSIFGLVATAAFAGDDDRGMRARGSSLHSSRCPKRCGLRRGTCSPST